MFHRFHRRPPSTPTSPLPDQSAPWESAPPINENPHAVQDVYPRPEIRPRSSNTSHAPPFLPPITRVTSNEPAHSFGLPDLDSRPAPDHEPTHKPPQAATARLSAAAPDSGFIGGVKYRRNLQDAAKFESSVPGAPSGSGVSSIATGLPGSHLTRSKPPPPPINTNLVQRPPPVPNMHSMHSMPPMQVRQAASYTGISDPAAPVPGSGSVPTGRRPAGTRLQSEPPTLAQANMAGDTHKTKKGLPFLKNPMSNLLGRKRAGHYLPEDVPVPQIPNEPAYQPIRGTRVHDFSVPRHQRQIFSESKSPNPEASVAPPRYDGPTPGTLPSYPDRVDPGHKYQLAEKPTVDERDHPALQSMLTAEEPQPTATQERDYLTSLQGARRVSTEKPLPEQPLPPIPPRDARRAVQPAPKQESVRKAGKSSTRSFRTVSVAGSSRTISVDGSSMVKPAPSTATNKSRFSHLSQKDGVASAVPAHMKSTSSRFSFMIGSASQEKIMEERHRQKELERQTTNPEPASGPRDSRFDDFDEDDIDYDAMMDDDGLEEPIPGVNADYDEDDYDGFEEPLDDVEEDDFGQFEPDEADHDELEPNLEPVPPIDDGGEQDDEAEMDPDNDQENFSGFVFQRSNPVSTLASPLTPGMAATPRDAIGNAIGFAMTKDGTPDLHDLALYSPHGQQEHDDEPTIKVPAAGLGIQDHDMTDHLQNQSDNNQAQVSSPLKSKETRQPTRVNEDELYFDQGLLDELDFGVPQSDVPFDESIFDNNDTDQYGRPIPGAFAQAQAMRAALMQDTVAQGSDATSRLSGQSQMSENTAHTSMSVGVQPKPSVVDKHRDATSISPKQEAPFVAPSNHVSDEERVVAYQAALAEAAHKAAASGKFRRDSSPPPLPTELVLTSPTASAPNSGRSHPDAHFEDLDNYEDDPYAQDMDDYDFDDDAIIAEANASALANDMDDFYGHEFGFYSAPAHTHGRSSHSKSSSASGSAPLNAQNLYEYSNGGYFGPSGLDRSTSGRVVTREPNLTPITERSEYSNRNSIMSMGLPPALGSGGDLRSPGLAQLAMMADDSDMNLSALMRLRSRAFGGSQVSLSPSSREGSPKLATGDREGAISPWGAQPSSLGVRDAFHGRNNSSAGFSVTSAMSRDSDAGSGCGSPTISMSMNLGVPPIPSAKASPAAVTSPQPSGSTSHLGVCSPVLEDEEASADCAGTTTTSSMSESALWMKSPADHVQNSGPSHSAPPSGPSQTRRPVMGHRHKGSADSISYIKEEDGGEARWVMERRRTAETGEVEVLGREVVTEGRI